jgi:hypothetical protein
LILGERPAGIAERGGIVVGEVWRDHRPALAAIHGFMNVLGARVDDVGVVLRDHDREGPLEAVLEIDRRMAHWIVGPRIDVPNHASLRVETRDQVPVRSGVDDVGIPRISSDPSAFTAADVFQFAVQKIFDAVGEERHEGFADSRLRVEYQPPNRVDLVWYQHASCSKVLDDGDGCNSDANIGILRCKIDCAIS